MAKIKYGQIGVGHGHASKIQVYDQSADYEVVGIAEPDEELRRAAQASPTYKNYRWMTVEQLLNVEGLEVVGIETRPRDALINAGKCVAAGKHIHLDKPAGESLPRFKAILDEAARKHLVVQMGYMYRYNPAIIMMRDLLKKGVLGEPFEVHTVMSKKSGASLRKELAIYPGGTMFELGCHLIDLVVGCLGVPNKIHAFARHSSDIKDGLQDNMLSVFEYDKATASIRSSVNEVDGFARRHFVLCGTEGTFHIQPLDNPKVQVALSKPHNEFKQGYQEIRLPGYRRYVADAADLAKMIRHEKDADFSYEHDHQVQKAVLLASGVSID